MILRLVFGYFDLIWRKETRKDELLKTEKEENLVFIAQILGLGMRLIKTDLTGRR